VRLTAVLKGLEQERQKAAAAKKSIDETVSTARSQIAVARRERDAMLSHYLGVLGRSCSLTAIRDHELLTLSRAQKEVARLSTFTDSVRRMQAEAQATLIRDSGLKNDLEKLERDRGEQSLRLQAAQLALARLDGFVDTTQAMRRVASEQAEELINRFVALGVKERFATLFDRIARGACCFHVTIAEARVRYHQPQLEWRATYGDRQYLGQGVFSHGELNAAALAFFLALATVQPGHLGVLLLDDPIQSMDELHIGELAKILKVLKDQLGWQLLIGFHEESVFRYFKRELFPSRPDQSLRSYVFEASPAGSTVVEDEKLIFSPEVFCDLPRKHAA
jgi:exonuclease SbcC